MEKVGAKRKIFRDEAVDAIHKAARGTPREINNICDVSLLLGFGSRVEEVDTGLIQKASAAVKQI